MDQSTLHETAELASRIHLLDDRPAPDAPTELADALRSGNVLRIAYRDRGGADTLRDVEPLGYVGKGRDWYLIGWCRLRDGIRAFRGDRMMSAETTGDRTPRRSLRAEDLDIAYGALRSVSTGKKDSQTPT